MADDCSDGAAQLFLHRRDPLTLRRRLALPQLVGWLNLPAVVVRPAVGDRELVALRGHLLVQNDMLGAQAPVMRIVIVLLIGITSGGAAPTSRPGLQYDHGGIIRGDIAQKRLSIVFTAGDFGEGVPHILDVCRERRLKTAFFVTGA